MLGGLPNLQPSEPFFHWQQAGKPVSIHVGFHEIAQLEAEVTSGSDGGETGGLLLGRVAFDGTHHITIEGHERVAGEFWRDREPSGSSRRALERALARWRPTPDKPLCAVGYYRTHHQEKLLLNQDDLFLIARQFSAPHNIILLIKPSPNEITAGGFFIWEHGQIHEEATPFPFQKEMLQTDSDGPGIRKVATSARMRPQELPEPATPAQETAEPRRRPGWPWFVLAGLCVLLALGVLGYVRLGNFQNPPPAASARPELSLRVERSGSDFRVTWNHHSPEVAKASGGALAVLDGAFHKELALNPEQLRSGSLFYSPFTSDVNFNLKVFVPGQEPVSESVRVLAGSPPAARAAQPPAEPLAPPAKTTAPASAPAPVQKTELVAAQSAPTPAAPKPAEPVRAAPRANPPEPRGIPRAQLVPAPPVELPFPPPVQPTGSQVYVPPKATREVTPATSQALSYAQHTPIPAQLRIDVRVHLDATGKVISAESLSKGDRLRDLLSKAAVDAVRRWQFAPARMNGRPVPGETTVSFRWAARKSP